MKIAILDGAVLNPGDVDWSPITSLGDVSIYDTTPTEAVAERTRGADVVLVNKTPLTGPNLEQLDNSVRMVGVLATGYNTVDAEAFAERNIPDCNVVAYGVDDVAQLLWHWCHPDGLKPATSAPAAPEAAAPADTSTTPDTPAQ